MMDLERLIKFVKLANNNPNEHEANSAARRVCRMIEEAGYKFTNGPTTWNDVKRSEEPAWRGTQPGASGRNWMWEDFMRQYGFGGVYEESVEEAKARQAEEERKKKEREERRKKEQAEYQQNQARGRVNYNPFDPGFYEFMGQRRSSRPRPSEQRVCTVCGLKVDTYNTAPIFVCTICLMRDPEL